MAGRKPTISAAIRRGAAQTRPVTGMDLGRAGKGDAILPAKQLRAAQYANVIGAAMIGSGCRSRDELLKRFPAFEQHVILPGLRYRNETQLIEVLERADTKRQLSREEAAELLKGVGL